MQNKLTPMSIRLLQDNFDIPCFSGKSGVRPLHFFADLSKNIVMNIYLQASISRKFAVCRKMNTAQKTMCSTQPQKEQKNFMQKIKFTSAAMFSAICRCLPIAADNASSPRSCSTQIISYGTLMMIIMITYIHTNETVQYLATLVDSKI